MRGFYFAGEQVFGSDFEPSVEKAVEEFMSSGYEPLREEVADKLKQIVDEENKVI